MKKLIGLGLLPLAAAGCLNWSGAKAPVAPPAAAPPRPAVAVSVEQISSTNAHHVADKLQQELERDVEK